MIFLNLTGERGLILVFFVIVLEPTAAAKITQALTARVRATAANN